jgi:type IV pilus assembly protein PilM
MFRLTRAQVQPIGLDIGHDSIKMMQTEVVGDSLCIRAVARQSLPDECKASPEMHLPMAVDAIKQMIRHNGFSGRRVVASIPRGMLHVKNLRLPQIPASELAAAVKFEAQNIFPFDTEQAHVHYLLAGEVRQGADTKQEVIVLAARNEDIDNYVEQLHRADVLVESIDAEPCAMFRSIERFIRRREDEQEVQVLLDIGLRRSQVIIGRGRDISFFKPIDIGGAKLHWMRRERCAGDWPTIPRPTIRSAIRFARRFLMRRAASWRILAARSRCACAIIR